MKPDLEALLETQRSLERQVFEMRLSIMRRDSEMVHRKAFASVCQSVASVQMMAAISLRDAKEAGRSAATGFGLQMAAAMAMNPAVPLERLGELVRANAPAAANAETEEGR